MTDAHVVRAVIFDMGGTLWFEATPPDEQRIYQLSAERLAPLIARWGITVDDSLEAIEREIWERALDDARIADERRTYEGNHLPTLIREALARRGITISDAQAEEWWRTAYLPVREFNWQLYPDAIHVLSELKDLRLKIGVCTNRPFTSEMFSPDLKDYGLAPYIDAVVCSGDTPYVKPHPAPLRLILDRLAVAPAEAVMVGDSCRVDVEGAKAVGMGAVLKLNGRYDAPPCAAADHAIHDLGELLDLPLLPPCLRAVASTESLTPHEDRNEERY